MSEIIDLKTAKESTTAQIWESVFEIFPEFKELAKTLTNEVAVIIEDCEIIAYRRRNNYDMSNKFGRNRAKKYRYKQLKL